MAEAKEAPAVKKNKDGLPAGQVVTTEQMLEVEAKRRKKAADAAKKATTK